jgi:hypothetical protein
MSGWRRRRASGGADDEQSSVGDDGERCGTPGVGKMRRTWRCERLRIGSELRGRTGRAVLRVSQMTKEIVVLEGRRRENDEIQNRRDGDRSLRAISYPPNCHLDR